MKQLFYFVLLLVLFISCTYTLEKKFINPISQPAPINLTADIDAPNFTDPYLLDWLTTFKFQMSNTIKPVIQYAVTVDGNPITSNYSNNALTFSLNPSALGTGKHSVFISIKLNTQSGSLANQLQIEYYPVEKKFDVIVQANISNPTLTLPPKIENGYLTMRWSFPDQRLYQIEVVKYKLDKFGLEDFIERKTFWATSQILFIDSGYVGGKARYRTFVKNYVNSKPIGDIDVNKSPGIFSITKDVNNFFTLNWTTTIANANFYLSSSIGSVSVPFSAGKISLDSLFLGDVKSFRFFVQRNNSPKQAYDSAISLSSKMNMPVFKSIVILPTGNKFMLLQDYDILRGSLIDFTIEDKISNGNNPFYLNSLKQMLVSPSEQSLIFGVGKGNPITMQPSNFSTIKFYRMQVVYPDNSTEFLSARSYSTVSEDGMLGANISYSSNPRPAILDLNVNTDVDPFNSIVWMDSVNQDVPTISQDGQYFCLNTSNKSFSIVYKKILGVWTQVGKLPIGKRYFRGKGTTELVNINSEIQVYNVNSTTDSRGFFQPIRKFSYDIRIPIDQINYDYLSESLSIESIDAFNYSTIKVYGISSFAFKLKTKAYLMPSSPYPSKHIYTNNFHFVTSGFGEKLNP